MNLFRPFDDIPFPRLIDVHVHVGGSDTDELYYPELDATEY